MKLGAGHYVAGWMIAARESAELAEQIIADTAHKQGIVLSQFMNYSGQSIASACYIPSGDPEWRRPTR
jgi:hypothetical protein